MIRVEKISFSYGNHEILKEVSFSINKGEIVGILGSNGAGKSTLFKLLNGRLLPGSGDIFIDDKRISDYSSIELARETALVPQNPSVSFPFTVYETIAMGRRPYQGLFSGISENDGKVIDAVMDETGLRDFSDRKITELSAGESQLVFLARAFAQEPEILLLDEATSSLDINHTLDILNLIKRRVRSEYLTVAAIVHDINLAALFCDKILFINNNSVIGPGTPEEMITTEYLSDVYGIGAESAVIENNPLGVRYCLKQS
jgi:iron complex transport system ATP-binding protein